MSISTLENEKIALVTGASGCIGQAIVEKLVNEGYTVGLHYNKNVKTALNLADKLQKQGGKTFIVQADISNAEEVKRMFSHISELHGDVNVLVNNAGINGGRSTVVSLDESALKNTFDVNVFGTIYCIQNATIHMERLGYGAIVNITSQVAEFGGNELAHYAASKGAIVSYTIAAAKELIKKNIRLNNVSPGVVATSENLIGERQLITKQLPIGRMAKPCEIANVVSWLVSEESSYIAGATIPVAGAR